jgi:ribosomal protein S27AE
MRPMRRLPLWMDAADNLIHLDRVRCLECGTTYVKPVDGGTVSENPGCPRCGYVGWIPSGEFRKFSGFLASG